MSGPDPDYSAVRSKLGLPLTSPTVDLRFRASTFRHRPDDSPHSDGLPQGEVRSWVAIAAALGNERPAGVGVSGVA